jgi:hypothetical protein
MRSLSPYLLNLRAPRSKRDGWYVYSEVFDLKPTSGLSVRKTG